MFKKFVTLDSGSFSRKRKQSPRACEDCRKAKKRCAHTPPSKRPWKSVQESSVDEQSPNAPSIGSTIQNVHETPTRTHDQDPFVVPEGDRSVVVVQQAESHISTSPLRTARTLDSRFIGDLNPEGIFQAATSPGNTRGADTNDSIGVWLDKRLNQRTNNPGSTSLPSQSTTSLFYGSGSLVQNALLPMLQEEVLSTLPLPTNIDTLTKIYFERIHPLFPVIDRPGFERLPAEDPGHILLQQAMCLAASKNYAAKVYLVLQGSEARLSHREFGQRLFGAMRLSVEMGLVTDKTILIQAITMMSHFADGPESGDISSQLCARAVHHVHSIGLHLQSQSAVEEDQYGITLFCCVWALDHMNAAFHGRPLMMHERDFGRGLEHCIGLQEVCFRLLLHTILLLDKVIGLYRPISSSNEIELESGFPSFEELITKCAAFNIPTQLLATIETLYHAVAILSHRSRPGLERPIDASTSELRQTLASSRVSSTVGREYRDQLVLFPFVPYAVSLSLSIAYRELRHNKVPMLRARARVHFQTTCDMLYELGEIFWSAKVMAEMGRSILKEVDRIVLATVGTEQQRGLANDNSSASSAVESRDVQSGEAILTSANPLWNSAPLVQDFDPTLFDSVSDLDLFDMFDPSFDINGIDACLQGNLDLSFPNTL